MAQIGYGMLLSSQVEREPAHHQRMETADFARHQLRRCTHCGWWRFTAEPRPGHRVRKKRCKCIRQSI